MTGPLKRPDDLRAERRRKQHGCWGHVIVAPLWVAYQANLGTLLRTCDAAGACMAVPRTPHYLHALRLGNTLPVRSCVHWVHKPLNWLANEQARGARVLGVELAEGAVALAALAPARARTVVVLGHEHDGIPDEAWGLLDDVVEIPMVAPAPASTWPLLGAWSFTVLPAWSEPFAPASPTRARPGNRGSAVLRLRNARVGRKTNRRVR